MLEFDALRIVFETQALAFITAQNVPCKIGDEPFNPPTDGTVYTQFWFRPGKTKQIELGPLTGFECTPGILQFTVYAPEKVGIGAAGRLGGLFKKAFNRKQWQVPPNGYVTIEPVSVQNLGVRNGHHVIVADAGFDFYHRDPDAS